MILKFDLKITNNEFKSKFDSTGITTSGSFGDSNTNTKITITDTKNLPELFYRIEGLDDKYTNTFPSSVYTETENQPKISFVESKFNKDHRVTGVGSTTISFTLAGTAETTSYDSTGFSTAFYTSESNSIQGGINSIDVNGEILETFNNKVTRNYNKQMIILKKLMNNIKYCPIK